MHRNNQYELSIYYHRITVLNRASRLLSMRNHKFFFFMVLARRIYNTPTFDLIRFVKAVILNIVNID